MTLSLRTEFVLILILGLILASLIFAGVKGGLSPLPALRLVLGTLFVLFIPGYALQAVLFPRHDDLPTTERLALSFGLSVAILPPIALLLDNLPWGIQPSTFIISLSLLILVCQAAGLYRRGGLPAYERFVLGFEVDVSRGWMAQDHTQRILYSLLTGALLAAAISAIAMLFWPEPAERFTEFYILGSAGLAEEYPHQVVVGEPLSVTVGITNREGLAKNYRIEVYNNHHLVNQTSTISLEADASDERLITFAPVESGDDVPLMFWLYRGEEKKPYRTLRLWIKVQEKE